MGGFGGFDCSCSRASFQGNHQHHAHRRRAFFVEAKVAVGKNKASKATPAMDNCKGRVQRKVLVERGARFRCFNRCLHRKGAPDGKPTPNAETWESRSALATRHERQPCRLFPRQANQRCHRETDRGDGTRPRIRRDGEALGVPTEIIEQRATTCRSGRLTGAIRAAPGACLRGRRTPRSNALRPAARRRGRAGSCEQS